jgi:hypothetical protein
MLSPVICTLFEGDYNLGAAGLVNSLHASGFRGRFICGYRGPLPFWAEPSQPGPNATKVRLLDGIKIVFVPLSTTAHFTNYKPTFLLEVWKEIAPDAPKIYYLDPDIVIKCPWDVMERWTEGGGIGLCEDVNFYLPSRHPLRLAWHAWLQGQNIVPNAPPRERYYSGGFIGAPIAARSFLELWRDLIARAAQVTGSLDSIKHGNPTSLFHTIDQDALNIALMCTDVIINATGPEGMDFFPGGSLLSHAIGSRKPWRGRFVTNALRGYPPSMASKAFFNYATEPIPIFSFFSLTRLKATLTLAAFIGRFYRRS